MAISAIGANTVCSPKFTAKKKDENGYENPINRKTERNLGILSSVGISTLVGATATGLASCILKSGLKSKWSYIIGLGAMALSLILTLPSKLYNTKVNAFAREKEMDVFSRQKEAQTNIYGGINGELKDGTASLDTSIDRFAKVRMADNGRGMLVTGA